MITIKSKKLLLLLLIFNVPIVFNGKGQVKEITDSSKAINGKNYYLVLSAGLKNAIFRDFATSPLFYNGYGLELHTEWLKRSQQKERSLEFGLGFYSMSARIPKSDYIQPRTNAVFAQGNIRYNRLFQLKSFSNTRFNYKLGGTLQTTQNLRLNPNLDNNGLGLENITNIMFSAQITSDCKYYMCHYIQVMFRGIENEN